jgi:hypothetical protein
MDELGFVPFTKEGAEALFTFCSSRYERGSLVITTNLDFARWKEIFGDEALTGALLDRLTHRYHILEMNGDSYRFKESLRTKKKGCKLDIYFYQWWSPFRLPKPVSFLLAKNIYNWPQWISMLLKLQFY